ncbi:hypothetical protein [Erythrobacter alti]|uniref:hypothetical protein n=1 Tax=Erythrobacter alti TaxID=1896145 RepID=UPI0030F41D92
METTGRFATTKAPWHLWVVGVVSLLWNSGGVMSYMATKLGQLEAMEMPPEQLTYFANFPAWSVAFWAVGVWGAFIGSALLLLRRKLAVTVFGISIVGLIGTTFYQRVASELPASLDTTGHLLFALAIWVITIGLFLYARRMAATGVLR